MQRSSRVLAVVVTNKPGGFLGYIGFILESFADLLPDTSWNCLMYTPPEDWIEPNFDNFLWSHPLSYARSGSNYYSYAPNDVLPRGSFSSNICWIGSQFLVQKSSRLYCRKLMTMS